jgi:hypothetical protein
VDEEYFQMLESIKEAREVPKEVVEQLPPPYKYQYARVRDDIEV